MEMSNDYMPELHVAQQRRKDKLRFQQLEDLHPNNFHHSSSLVFPSEMLNFPASQSAVYANIHPSRFVTPSTSDSCDPRPLQSFDNWVSSYDYHGRRNLSHFLPHINNSSSNNCSNNPTTATAEVLAAHYYNQSHVNSWENGANELPLLPSFVSQANDASHGLSLSLSSNQICEMHHLSEPRELKPLELGTISPIIKLDSGKNQIQDVVVGSSTHVYRNVGPLGPFTGYATILRGSKFLKPAQVMLDEFLTAAGLRHVRECEEVESLPDSNALVPKFHSSNDMSSGSVSCESYRPDCNEKKAKLLHMQEEVCKRHKQYHQQMEMVISAFESVPGLSNATPYISRSLKIISRHFKSLKNAIADQVKLIKRALGEDLSTPTSYMKGDNSSSRFEHSFARVKTGGIGGTGFGAHQNHIWRPQRGLPERAVSVLRAWLFDHFLHPYPTDTDKQMLASQTGLSRNQVSNWFINARVRIWKPMVEEIHMLETKNGGRSEPNPNQKHTADGHKPAMNAICDSKQLDYMGSSSYMEESRGESNANQLAHNKTSRIETHQIPTTMDGSIIGFLPYQRRGMELGGLGGAVSLTLGLRHGSETTHQQQLQHQFQHQGMHHFGGHVMHDFTG